MTAQIEAVDFFAFDNSYARLPDRFFARLPPTPVAAPRLVRRYCFEDPLDAEIFRARFEPKIEHLKLAG